MVRQNLSNLQISAKFSIYGKQTNLFEAISPKHQKNGAKTAQNEAISEWPGNRPQHNKSADTVILYHIYLFSVDISTHESANQFWAKLKFSVKNFFLTLKIILTKTNQHGPKIEKFQIFIKSLYIVYNNNYEFPKAKINI